MEASNFRKGLRNGRRLNSGEFVWIDNKVISRRNIAKKMYFTRFEFTILHSIKKLVAIKKQELCKDAASDSPSVS